MSSLSEAIELALAKVIDPELGKPITELDMVGPVTETGDSATVEIKLTVGHCPQADWIEQAANKALAHLPVTVKMSVMSKTELDALKIKLRGKDKQNPFGPGTSTKVILVGSGKGGVGKSTITANLAVAIANAGHSVGLIDADIFGFSITSQLGMSQRPTRLDDMMLPPVAHGVKVISIGMFVDGNEAISWRGPMLHKAIEQFLTDVYWGQLDYLLIDMPPGTGDVAISIGQLLPNAKALVITTPQSNAALVAVRSGLAAIKAGHQLIGVVENMSYLETETGRQAIFGSGGGELVAKELSNASDHSVPLLIQIPISSVLSANSDAGRPLLTAKPNDPAAVAIAELAKSLEQVKLSQGERTLNVKLGS